MAREIGMPMCSELVLAVRDGQKTETRRVVKPQPLAEWTLSSIRNGLALWAGSRGRDGPPLFHKLPYQVGDRLWIREGLLKGGGVDGNLTYIMYAADGTIALDGRLRTMRWRWKRDFLPSIFMPSDCCRFWRTCMSVGLERVQEIDVAGILREGCPPGGKRGELATAWFRELWDGLNGKRGYDWDSNPWVWVPGWENDTEEAAD